MTEQGYRTKPNPNQPDRCPSIDPHDTLQCTRRIHEDDECHCGGIAWRKGTPRYISDREKLDLLRTLAESWIGFDDSHSYGDAVLKVLSQ